MVVVSSSENAILLDVGQFRQPELPTSTEYQTVSAVRKFASI